MAGQTLISQGPFAMLRTPDMSGDGTPIAALPHALRDHDRVVRRLAGRTPVVFLDYDGTLTPIVERPEDAVISDGMRATVRALADRVTVCVVSGRDRAVVQRLMGIDDLVVAGSHGFDIWEPRTGTMQHEAVGGFEELLARTTELLRERTADLPGARVEPKRASVAVHYRQVAPEQRPAVHALVDAVLAADPDRLKVTPGKLVYEIQPRVDWNKGRALLFLLHALRLDGDGTAVLYLGDDITDEDAFRALSGLRDRQGTGIVVADVENDPREAERVTAADFVLHSTEEVQRFLDTVAV